MEEKILVLSNNCFSKSNSNGRTLGNLFSNFPKENIAQFYVKYEKPEFSMCENYYCTTDRQALKCFLGKKTYGHKVNEDEFSAQESGSLQAKPVKKTSFNRWLRSFIWKRYKWADATFWDFIDDFKPTMILLQVGDDAFMCHLALKLKKKYNIPIVIYNSESYYFKNFDYFSADNFLNKLFYPIFRCSYKRAFKKLMKNTSHCVYLCDKLKRDYDKLFNVPSTVIYGSSEMSSTKSNNDKVKISYLGNLGLDRHTSLIEIAKCINSLSRELKLDVYGKASENIIKEFNDCEGIDYKGFISYEQVKSVIENSDILIHTESFDKFYARDLEYAFTTKISDSLASGKCFFVYAPKSFAFYEYLSENQVAFVASTIDEMKAIFSDILFNKESREKHRDAQLLLVEKNHRLDKNSDKFIQILLDCKKVV